MVQADDRPRPTTSEPNIHHPIVCPFLPTPHPRDPSTIYSSIQVHRNVLAAEEEKARIQQEIAALSERLKGLDAALAGRLQARVEYDRTIRETEIAYAKIVESSSTLLRVLRREATHLAQGQGQGQGQGQQQQQQQQQVAKGWEQYSYPPTGGGGVRRGVE